MKIISILAFLFHYQLYTCVAEEHSSSLVQAEPLSLKQEGVGRNTWNERFVGCYKDGNSPRDLPHRKIPVPSDYAKTNSWRGMFPELCMMLCKEKQFPYAGLQNGRECYCSDKDWSPQSPRYGKQRRSKCNRPCQNHDRWDCGGAWHNSVYKVELPYKVKSYEMVDVVYTPFKKMIEVEPDKPEVMSSTQVINNGDEEQEMSEEITAVHTSSISISSTHDFTKGISVTWASNLFVAEHEVGISLEYGFSTTTGETKEESHEDTSAFTITVPPRSQCTVKLVGNRKESRLMYNGTLVTHYVQDDDDYEEKEPKREPVGGILDATATTNIQIKYERCTDICPPEKASANCRYVKKCKVEEDCGDGFECQCSQDCGMTCKREKPVHPCYQDTPVCKNDGTCKVVEVESGESRYADTNKVKSGKGASPIPDDPEYECDCVGIWQGKHCSWSMDLFAAGSTRNCKHGWQVDAGVLGTEWWEKDVECKEDEQCIRLEGEMITRGPIRHYHNVYRCYPRDNCQDMVDANCMPIALKTINSGYNFMVQQMTCHGQCCDTDHCNAEALDGSGVPTPSATTAAPGTTKKTTAGTAAPGTTKKTTAGTAAPGTTKETTAGTAAPGTTKTTTAAPGATPGPETTTTTAASTDNKGTWGDWTAEECPPCGTYELKYTRTCSTKDECTGDSEKTEKCKDQPPCEVPPKLELTVRFEEDDWSDDLLDPSSDRYKQIVEEMTATTKKVMGWKDTDEFPPTTWTFKKGSVIASAEIEMADEAAVEEGLKKVENFDFADEPRYASMVGKKIHGVPSYVKPAVTQPTKGSGGISVHPSKSVRFLAGIVIMPICFYLIVL